MGRGPLEKESMELDREGEGCNEASNEVPIEQRGPKGGLVLLLVSVFCQ